MFILSFAGADQWAIHIFYEPHWVKVLKNETPNYLEGFQRIQILHHHCQVGGNRHQLTPCSQSTTLRPNLALFTEVGLHHRAHTSMGGVRWRALWVQDTSLHRADSKSSTGMECKRLSGWSVNQLFCDLFHHQDAERPWAWSGLGH